MLLNIKLKDFKIPMSTKLLASILDEVKEQYLHDNHGFGFCQNFYAKKILEKATEFVKI